MTLTPIEELTYEQAFAELETIVAALESEERTLDESLAQFERGQALSKYCATLLDKAELKITQLTGNEITDFIPQA
ncbi:MAG: exodeoxyribonuclease VII small subunit [Chloroflexi bacterium]|nr:exodeoxyribonuclease VII small subunit [Chloroflexota bacterium]MBU1661188.1 exodeoxyribonuclease VII small subunit [Chloroflexota bacterium]